MPACAMINCTPAQLVGLWAPAFKYVGVFGLYLLVVLWRPQGLFGRS